MGSILRRADLITASVLVRLHLLHMLSIFAVVNIVTGVFVDCAMHANKSDTTVMLHEELDSKRDWLKKLRDIFDEIDDDDTGCINLDELERNLTDERVAAYLHALKLDVNDARMMFTLLDYDQSGHITVEEFLDGCYKLQGESRTFDLAVMRYEVKWVQRSLTTVLQSIQELKSAVGGKKNIQDGLRQGNFNGQRGLDVYGQNQSSWASA